MYITIQSTTYIYYVTYTHFVTVKYFFPFRLYQLIIQTEQQKQIVPLKWVKPSFILFVFNLNDNDKYHQFNFGRNKITYKMKKKRFMCRKAVELERVCILFSRHIHWKLPPTVSPFIESTFRLLLLSFIEWFKNRLKRQLISWTRYKKAATVHVFRNSCKQCLSSHFINI